MLSRIGFLLGPLLLAGWLLTDPGSLTPQAHRLAGIMLLTVLWWGTEPIPNSATGLLAIVLCLLLDVVPGAGQRPAADVLAAFAEPTVFFMLGGLFLGRAMFKHGLDRRLALAILRARWAGRNPGTVLAAVGLGVMLMSMWISNTAATAMMVPVALGIIAVLAAGAPGDIARSPYASALLLMTAFASSVGGIATPIGTPTNMVAIGFFKQPEYFGQPVNFLRWGQVGVPLMVVIFVGLYAWLRFQAPASGLELAQLRAHLHEQYDKLGPWCVGEIHTLIVFVIVVGLWVTPGLLTLAGWTDVAQAFSRRCPEEVAALLAPVLLFLLPVNWRQGQFALEGSDLREVDWGIILLFGSGLALGGLMFRTGLAQVVGRSVFDLLGTRDLWTVTAVAITGGIFLSEFMGNAAAAATLLPMIRAACAEAEIDPLPPLMGVAFAASFGSALPVSTPPNAIVYSSGLLPVRRMIAAGVGLDLLCAAAIWGVLRFAYALGWTPFTGG